jgi:hypothetical protein
MFTPNVIMAPFGLTRVVQVLLRQEKPGHGGALTPLALRKIGPIDAATASDRLGWVGLDASRYSEAPAFEFNPPAITHHRLILYTRPPEELDLLYEGVKRHVPPPAGAIFLVPAGSPHWVRSPSFKLCSLSSAGTCCEATT